MSRTAFLRQSSRRLAQLVRAAVPAVESLESRQLLSAAPVNVLNYRYDISSSGVNSNEVQLTPQNVKVGSFGKIAKSSVSGAIYAEPLVDNGITIANGVNTASGAAGVHNVVFVATETDSVYAFDSTSGALLWQRNFLNTANSGGDINNTLGAASLAAPDDTDVGLPDSKESWGITGTPVIDPSTNVLYVDVRTKEVINGVTQFVQRLHGLNLADGTDAAAPFTIGDTIDASGKYTNNTPIYVYGTGDGATTDPYNGTGKQVIQFNALRELQRPAINLENGQIYVAWASNGDNGPYHGFIASWSVANIKTSGFTLTGVLCTSPNDSEAGIWQSGGALAFEPDGSAFYCMTGNGSGGAPTLGANGLPSDANYNEAVIKVEPDPASTAADQNPNGWGMKVVDFFTPYNVEAMDNADSDFGSGAPLLLPASAGIPGHPNLLIAGGKDGRLYVLDRDDLGGYHSTYDDALNAVPNSAGVPTPPDLIAGTLSTPVYYNGKVYVVAGYLGNAKAFTISSTGQLVPSSTSNSPSFGGLPGGPTVSSDGASDGIVWFIDLSGQDLQAYDASSLSTLLWTSNQAAGEHDALGAGVKFAEPTVANGEVFVGTQTALVIYGLTPPAGAIPSAPAVAAAALSSSSINLTWTDSTKAPNTATGYLIEESTDGKTFTQVTTAPAGATSIAVGGLAASTIYYFRVIGFNVQGDSANSNSASATTLSSGGTSSGVSPNAPTGLGASAASATSIYLTWTPNSTDETGYHLDRASDPNFTQNLMTEDLPAGISSYTDTASGLAPGLTFYYRLRAFNSAGDSGNSNVGSATIPDLPPKPTDQSITNVTTDEIDMQWQDNAGHLADGYRILRAENNGAFSIIVSLPPTSAPAPSEYSWSDTTVTPGNYYEYHIEAYNVSGNEDFAGVNATTITAAPGGVVAAGATDAVNLSWTAVTGAVSYNIYRGTTPGGESATPIATGVTADSYDDANVTPGVKYYYEETAVNGNAAYTPPLPSESARSAETSAVPAAPGSTIGIFANALSIGTGLAGSAAYSNGVYTMSGSGADIWGASDSFEYAYNAVAGNAAVVAEVNSVQYVNAWSKAGVMIRASTAANSAFADVVVTPGGYVAFQWRLATGQTCEMSAVTLKGSPPQWVKLVRTGNSFTAFYSSNGTAWTALGGAVTIAMPASATAGLAVSSLYVPKLCAATFSNVSLTSATSASGSAFANNLTIGTGLAGSAGYSNGAYTIAGSGADIWGTSDGFDYNYGNVSGDTTIVAQVNSVQNTYSWAKAGVMIRGSTAANSAFADVVVTPAGYVAFQWRTASGQTCEMSAVTLKNSPPQWVKLVRSGNLFTAFYSSNGTTWTALGGAVSIAMSPAVTAGLAVSSLVSTELCTATFSNVSVTG